jgi:hypothetical protein
MKYLKTYKIFEAKVSYSAVVIDEKEKQRLLNELELNIPEGWEIITHHMTIKMGELPKELKTFLYTPIKMKVVEIGDLEDMVLAIKVEVIQDSPASKALIQYMSENYGFKGHPKFSHITIAVNREKGAKPFQSNEINNFEKINKQLYITGTIIEL